MYEVDDRDRVVELHDLPQSCAGAPMPRVLADESNVVLAYYIQEREFAQSAGIKEVGPDSVDSSVALIRFSACSAHQFGPPNDETFHGHPLAGRGLHPYGIFRVDASSWIRKLERMNSVHPCHQPERFWKKQHVVFAFHDSTFECVCDSFDVQTTKGPISGVFPQMQALFK